MDSIVPGQAGRGTAPWPRSRFRGRLTQDRRPNHILSLFRLRDRANRIAVNHPRPYDQIAVNARLLKLLGKEVAFVAVKDQNHHILDYQKRLEWQETIWAWFAKWLQDDPSWWDAVYSPKSL